MNRHNALAGVRLHALFVAGLAEPGGHAEARDAVDFPDVGDLKLANLIEPQATEQCDQRHPEPSTTRAQVAGDGVAIRITLTMKQGLNVTDGFRDVVAFLDADKASQNLRHFLNMLNRTVLGRSFSRFGQRLRVIPVLEAGDGRRLHYHLTIDCPRAELQEAFPETVRETWSKTDWAFHQTDIQPNADKGWINYKSKCRDKPVFADAIDWANYHNPD